VAFAQALGQRRGHLDLQSGKKSDSCEVVAGVYTGVPIPPLPKANLLIRIGFVGLARHLLLSGYTHTSESIHVS
jgi:hypothetical protein